MLHGMGGGSKKERVVEAEQRRLPHLSKPMKSALTVQCTESLPAYLVYHN
jgi:hypothetical protein